jgi:hypothetical protein
MRSTLGFALVLVGVVAGRASAEEPRPPGGVIEDSPSSRAAPARTPSAAAASNDPRVDHKYALGARLRYIFVTQAMMSPFLTASTDMNSVSTALEFSYRRPTFDVVTSLDFSWLALNDGNYLASGHPPDLDTHYVQFRNLSFLSIDVSILGHNWLTKWLEIRYGAGLGLGVVMGDVLLTNNGTQCTLANVHDTSQCHPVSPTQGPIIPGTPGFEDKLKATEAPKATDTAQDPHRGPGDKPPVMAVVNIMIGLRFKVHQHVLLGWDLGFRNAIFTGVGVHYLF